MCQDIFLSQKQCIFRVSSHPQDEYKSRRTTNSNSKIVVMVRCYTVHTHILQAKIGITYTNGLCKLAVIDFAFFKNKSILNTIQMFWTSRINISSLKLTCPIWNWYVQFEIAMSNLKLICPIWNWYVQFEIDMSNLKLICPIWSC